MQVLKLTNGGLPTGWISREEAVCLVFKRLVSWSLGPVAHLRGGHNRLGARSVLDVPAIIAVNGERSSARDFPLLTNRALFRRDGLRCMYCGGQFSLSVLTRDHIVPRSRGGLDIWTNVVASCKACNHGKGARTPEEAGMALLGVPYVPNPYEFAYLQGRTMLGEQQDYLSARFRHLRLVV